MDVLLVGTHSQGPNDCHSKSIHLSLHLFTSAIIPPSLTQSMMDSFTPAAPMNKHWMPQITVSSKVRALMGDSTGETGEEGREEEGRGE